MSNRILWSPSEDATSYQLARSTSSSGTFSLISTVSHAIPGAAYDQDSAAFFYLDYAGTAASWYQVTPYLNTTAGTPTDPFQVGSSFVNVLASLADLKTYLGVTHATDDVLLSRLLAVASDWFRSATSRDINLRYYEEQRDGNGTKVLVLENYPVRSVTNVIVDGTAVSSSSWVNSGAVIYLKDGSFTEKDRQNVVIAYEAGFSVVPSDVQQAVIEFAALKYRERQHVGNASTSLAGQSVTFLPALIPQSIQNVVDLYTRATRF